MRLLVIFGPPAVGKMTVGRAVAARSDVRLLHGHALLEPMLEVFDHGTEPFERLLGEFRGRVIEVAAAAGTDLLPDARVQRGGGARRPLRPRRSPAGTRAGSR